MKRPLPRFARSINVERDTSAHAIDGYLPVGRAIDAIARLARALDRRDGEIAFSITGPYGSGKSSLGVVIDALLSASSDPSRHSAEELIRASAPEVLPLLHSALQHYGAFDTGFLRAVVTARREPIAATVVRALLHGAQRFVPASGQAASHRKALANIGRAHASYVEGKHQPTTREIRALLAELSQLAPVLLLIDEFGKSLEAFADARNETDLYLLQEIAEWTRGTNDISLALITLQHMAFDEYAEGATIGQRREWAKIQGRFEDVPFIDGPAQTRALIGAAFETAREPLSTATSAWAQEQTQMLRRIGMTELADDTELMERAWPLHPLVLAVLPALCERYGQNERTLFSFLASSEPLSVGTFLEEVKWKKGANLPVVRLDRVYDYFLESAATMIGVSSSASRWLEVDTRIRDAHGLAPAALRVLKTVGVLNLVSAGGSLRASKSLVPYAAADGAAGTENAQKVLGQLEALEDKGLITFRDFADEYRVWKGTDFDLRSAIDRARHRVRNERASRVLQAVLPLDPLVAARHSHNSGTLRAFQRSWVDPGSNAISLPDESVRADGSLLYVLGEEAPSDAAGMRSSHKPVIFMTTQNPGPLVEAAREVAAIDEVLNTASDLNDDWVAKRELLERRLEARLSMNREFEEAFGAGSTARGEWTFMRRGGRKWIPIGATSVSGALSAVADSWYDQAPIIKNDLVNRHDLSSQAAKARRVLLEAAISASNQESLGISGFGPDKTMYLSVLKELGLHRQTKDGTWQFSPPDQGTTIRAVWDLVTGMMRDATDSRIQLDLIYDQLAAPPYGVRSGVSPIIVVTALIVLADDVAIYEHGTFRPALTSQMLERLLRNPGNFELKSFAAGRGNRAVLLTELCDCFGIEATRVRNTGRVSSVLAVVSHLVLLINRLPDYSKNTTAISKQAIALRRALLSAVEPDELLFQAIPTALGFGAVRPGGSTSQADLPRLAQEIKEKFSEVQEAFPRLLEDVEKTLSDDLRNQRSLGNMVVALGERAREIADTVVDPRVSKLIVALTAAIPEREAWLQYAGQSIVGMPPEGWSDDERNRFFAVCREVCASFLRVEALNADLRSKGSGFDAVRITLTQPDGSETIKLVWLDDSRKETTSGLVEQAISEVQKRLGIDQGSGSSRSEARDVLLAALAELEIADRVVAREQLPSMVGRTGSDLGATSTRKVK